MTPLARLLPLALALTAALLPLSRATAQTGSAPHCLTDGYGDHYQVRCTPAPDGSYALDGFADVGLAHPWTVSGTLDSVRGKFAVDVINPFPDGCVTYSGRFRMVGRRTGGSLSVDWTNDCGLSGSTTATITRGACPDARRETGGTVSAPFSAAQGTVPYPNPVRELLHVPGGGTVRILDAAGRPVAELAPPAAAEGARIWSVTDAQGRRVPPGLYRVLVDGRSHPVLVLP